MYEFFEEVKRLYIVLEYCKGGELFNEIVKRKYLSETHAAHIMHQIFSAVDYLHSKNIMHRDLKPENIMLEERNEVMNIKIIDFGCATIYDNHAHNGLFGTILYIAPEVLLGSYDNSCDLWSCGVIFYILLCGYAPFDGQSDEEITEKIKSGTFNLTSDPWPSISKEAKNLINKLLCSAKKRITARQAMEKTYLSGLVQRPLLNDEAIAGALKNLQSFRSKSLLRDAVNTFITTQCISASDTKELTEVFRKMDKNGDGKLSKEELLEEYSKIMEEHEAKAEVDRIMKEVDSDKNGFIEYSEFLKGSLDSSKILSAENLKIAFAMFDKDGNGTISAEELKKAIAGTKLSDWKIWNEIITEIDQNGDGEIDLQEFQKVILKTNIPSP